MTGAADWSAPAAGATAAAPATVARRVPRRRPPLAGELLIVFGLLRVYDWVKGVVAGEGAFAHGHAGTLVHAERLLHLYLEPGMDHWLAREHGLSLVASWYYQFAHIPVALGVLALCYVRWPWLYRPARNTLLATNVVGLVTFLWYPVMPPRLLPGGGFVDSVAQAGFGGNHGGPVPADQFAAMPSLHVAWALWAALVVVVACPARRAARLAYAYPVLTIAVVLTTGNHYLLDVLAAAATVLAAAALLGLRRGGRPVLTWRAAGRQAAGAEPAGAVGPRPAGTRSGEGGDEHDYPVAV